MLRTGAACRFDIVVVKTSIGSGARIISNGVLHRGAQDPSIICPRRNVDCREATASGAALSALGLQLADSARLFGVTLAQIVNFYNPSLILLGVRLMVAGDAYPAVSRNIVYSQ